MSLISCSKVLQYLSMYVARGVRCIYRKREVGRDTMDVDAHVFYSNKQTLVNFMKLPRCKDTYQF